MNHKKLIAGILAITLMGSGAILPPNAVKTLSDSIVMSVSAAGTNYSCSSFDFDASTGTMTLKGNVVWDDVYYFAQKVNVTSITAQEGTVFPSYSSYLFRDYSRAESIDLKNVNTSKVTNMYCMFLDCTDLNSLDVSGFDTSKVTNMNSMFMRCESLTSIDLSSFNTSNVTDMDDMFLDCSSLTSVDLSSFDTSKVTYAYMEDMFLRCYSLERIYVNENNENAIRNINTGGASIILPATNYSCDSFDFDASTGTMTLKGNVVYNEIRNFTQKYYVTSITAQEGTVFPSDCNRLFQYYSNVKTIDLKNVDTSKVTNMYCMFNACSALTSLDVSRFDTSNVTDMTYVFCDCPSLTSIDLSGFDTSNVTSMYGMFSKCSALTSIDLSGFDTSKVTDMTYMFSRCTSLQSVYVNSSNTTKVKNALSKSEFSSDKITSMVIDLAVRTTIDKSMLHDAINAFKPLHIKMADSVPSGTTTLGLNKSREVVACFDSKTSTMYIAPATAGDTIYAPSDSENLFNDDAAFGGKGNCAKIQDISLDKLDTSRVTNMSVMFYGCSSLTSLDVSNFDTRNVTSMSYMFYLCSSLKNLDVSNFDTRKVTGMGNMFAACKNLTTLDISGFDMSNVKSKSTMFQYSSALKTILVSEANKITINDALILNGLSTEDIDLLFPIKKFTTSSAISGGMTLDNSAITSDDLDHASIKSVDWYLMNADGTPGDEVTGGTAQAGKDYMAVVYLKADEGYCYTENSEISAENGEILASLLITEGTSKYISIGVNFSNVPKGTGKLEFTIPPLEIDKALFFQVRKFINTINGQQDGNYTVTVYDHNGLLGDERFPGTMVVENGQIVSFDPVLAHKLADDEEFEFVIVNTNPNYEFTSEDITVKGQENCDSCKLYDNSLHVFYKAEAWKTIVNIECPEDMTEPITVEFIRKDNGTLAKRKVVTPKDGLAKFSLAGFSSEYYVTFNSATYTAESYYYRNGNGAIPKVLMVKMAPCPVVTSASLTLDGTIGVNIKAEIPDEFMKCQAALHYDGTTTKTKFYTIKNLTKDSNGRYVFTFPVAAKEIADKVSFEIYDANFKPIKIVKGTAKAEIADNSFQYAATDYINSKKSSSDTKLASLCKALSDFGNASRIMFNYNATGAKIEQSLSGVTAATLKPYELVRDAECVDGIKISAASLIIESETTINIKFKTTRSSISGYTFTCDGKVVTPTKIAEGEYQVQVTNISAADLDKAHTFSVSDGKNTQKITYSALSYAYSKISSTDTKLSNLVKTLYLYNKAAKTYLGR